MTYMVLADGPCGAVVSGPFALETALRAACALTSRGCTQTVLAQCNTGFRLDFADFAAGALPRRRDLAGVRRPVAAGGTPAIGRVGQG
jgi:hypothetical protein